MGCVPLNSSKEIGVAYRKSLNQSYWGTKNLRLGRDI